MENITKNLLCVLQSKKIIRLKRNESPSKFTDKVFQELKQTAEQNSEIRYYTSQNQSEIILCYAINHIVDSFIV
jgi:hypothetical protein